MTSNIDQYEKDLERLISDGSLLSILMKLECYPVEVGKQLDKFLKDEIKNKKIIECKDYKKALPTFNDKYQLWYSESLVIIKLLLPDRLEDFRKHYEKPKGRKEINNDNYVIEDYLQGLRVTHGWEKTPVVSPNAAISRFEQQLNILKSTQKRFESSLFDIKQLLQADLFDSELEAAVELNKKGFVRGAGAMAGVVLESHLEQVCENHAVKVTKKDPTINDFNDLLKAKDVIDVSTWRFIQHLADLRNKCDHKKKADPTQLEIDKLIEGVGKITKTVF
jgi:hypothetical protein